MDLRRKLSSGGESFSEGTSRFFSSMIAKKNGLMNDLSNKFESVGANFMKNSSSEGSLSDSEGPVLPEANVYPKRKDSESNDDPQYPQQTESNPSDRKSPVSTRKTIVAEVNPIQKSLKDKENVQRAQSMDRNQNGRMASRYYHRQNSATSTGSSAAEELYPVTGVNMSFDEPLYSPSKTSGVGPSWKGKKTPPPIPPPPHNPNRTGRRSSRSLTDSPRMSSGHSSDSEKYVNDEVKVEERSKPPTFASTKRRSSTVDEMLFDDYVETQPEPLAQPEDNAVNKRKTLLPLGDLISFDEPELEDFHPKQLTNRKNKRNSGAKTVENDTAPTMNSTNSVESPVNEDDSAGNSLNNQVSVESSEPEYERTNRRLGSLSSDRSWSSSYSLDSQPDDLTLECMTFMKQFVSKVFNPMENISQMEKHQFGEYCQQVPGRHWFSRYINSQRCVSKKVDESIFFRLVQYFAVMLFECNEAEDYVPAKTLMNMCFTFYHESRHGKHKSKNFLYSYLREQPIWQSLRFWNAAFFDAVQNERARKPVCTSEDDHDFQNDDVMYQENITFGQLGSFTTSMRAFGLSKELCLEFIRKQSTIANLKNDQIKMLRDNIEKMKVQ